jgi:Arc/MetJ-type ribon-helix-helix transcriptional regulator
MGRPTIKESKRKVKTGVTIEPELYQWISKKIEDRTFSNVTHAVNWGLSLLKEKLEKNK